MKAKLRKSAKAERPFRYFPDDIEHIVEGYGPRARVVQLWRLEDGSFGRWIYLARIMPEQCTIEYIANRFGGGEYRAKILGEWDRQPRCEVYFERVSFAIDDFYKPTAETLARTRAALQK